MYCTKCGQTLNDHGICESCERPRPNRVSPLAAAPEKDFGGCVGIGSVASAVIIGIIYFVLIIIATFLTLDNPEISDEDPKLVVTGLGLIFLMAANFFIIILSSVFVFISKKRTMLALGIVFHALELLGILALVAIGIFME